MKLWSGRFKKDVDSRVNDFNSSISFDGRMYKQDIEGSIAHATMLGECGIIEKHESKKSSKPSRAYSPTSKPADSNFPPTPKTST